MPGVVEKSGASPGWRKALFYGVCVPLRLFLAWIVYTNLSPSLQVILLIVSAISVYINLLGMNSSNDIWWTQELHLLTSLSTFLILVARRPEFVPYVMVFDVLYGVVTSFTRDPF